MTRARGILLIVAIALVGLLFYLPKVVVDNQKEVVQTETHSADDGHDHSDDEALHEGGNESIAVMSHAQPLTEEAEKKAVDLKESLKSSTDKEKSAKFADSLSDMYLQARQLDSAARYAAYAAEQVHSLTYLKRAGDVYYTAFRYATDEAELNRLAEKTRFYYQQMLKQEPENLDVKANLAMTYIPTSNPMQGIMLLREVLEANPQHEEALFNMGVLSLQSGQSQKAVERFRKLIEVNPEHIQAHLFLGVAYMQTGEQEAARKEFETVKELDSDPAVQATADSYLQELN